MGERPKALVKRTFRFALEVRRFLNRLPKILSNYEDSRQLARSSGSVAANYLEAREGVSRKDFFYRIKICRKEARESGLWLRLVEVGGDVVLTTERNRLEAEANELKLIFAAIASKDDTTEVD